ncbi:4-hydroxybutyrate coenzyme A transferase [hydrothermal vent metagenome]|uniref:4-hydroxybutyrate coenzyme A transferase n=1 Tax=hydrothermal vent metagenome TaxID=652676 RepID=A0A3B0UT63_9ZZZZ
MRSQKERSPSQAVGLIKSGDRVYIHSAAATPQALVKAMVGRADELKGVEIYHLHTEGDASYTNIEYKDSFHLNALFLAPNARDAVAEGRADFIPSFLSEVPIMFRRGRIPLDVVLIQVSPPDKHGYCSLGVSIEATLAAMEVAQIIIAQINPQMPRTHGDGQIHINEINAYCVVDEPIRVYNPHLLTDIELEIGKHVAGVIEDGATLQMGIGAIPEAVLNYLGNHKDLGVHTEMFSDGILPLVKSGVINGKNKVTHPGFIVTGFLLGTRKLYDFVDDNPMVRVKDIEYVNDASVIRKNPKVTSINSAIEIDITGQVCADSIGTRIYSGVGGQMDFIRGASLSEGGKPIIALASRTKKGVSKIVSFLKQGAGVVTTRAHVHYIATEYGIVDLYAQSLRERARRLIEISHPDDREMLEKAAFERFK